MTVLQDRPRSTERYTPPVYHRRRRRPARTLCLLLVGCLVVLGSGSYLLLVRDRLDDRHRQYLAVQWPAAGQAAYLIDNGPLHASPHQRPVPIASVAKVMTAYLVLERAPLTLSGTNGFRLTVTEADVADTARRRVAGESVVSVRAGEVLTERQALAAVLLPSANNVAIMLARRTSGSVSAFVRGMNSTARRLHLTDTHYTDPSGLDPATVSTAADQTRLAVQAMRNPVFGDLVGRTRYAVPVVGSVVSTDVLLGKKGFSGIKTGSDDAAGGCFVFRARRIIDGRARTVTGAVLGQPGHNLTRTGQYAAEQLVDRLAS